MNKKIINYDFFIIFNEFLSRFFYSKYYLKFFILNDKFIYNKSIYFTKHYFSIFYLKFLFLFKQLKTPIFFFDFKSFILKDYYCFYILEFIIKYKLLIIKNSNFFNISLNKLILNYSLWKIRIDIITFFTLGRYAEILRSFYYNQYLSIHSGLLQDNDIKSFFKVKFFNRWSLVEQFKTNCMLGNYLIYDLFQKDKDEWRFKYYNKNFFIFSNRILNYFFKYLFLYQINFLYFFYIFFIFFLRPYVLMYWYKCWNIYLLYYKHFYCLKFFSIFGVYLFLFQMKSNFVFFVLYDLILFFRKKLNHIFIYDNINLLLSLESLFYLYSFDYDICVIDYISNLYYIYIDHFYLSEHLFSKQDFVLLWDIIESWGHIDYVFLPSSLHFLSSELISWLNLFKYNLEEITWSLYNLNLFNKFSLFNNKCHQNFIWINVGVKIGFFSIIFFDFLCMYIVRYCLIYLNYLEYRFVFDFLKDFSLKLIFLSNYFYDVSYNSYCLLKLKQFKYFFYCCLYYNRYIKLFEFYNNNICLYLK